MEAEAEPGITFLASSFAVRQLRMPDVRWRCGVLSKISVPFIAVLVLFISVTACGTENGGTPSSDEIAAAQTAADASLLKIEDFPSDWTFEPNPSEEGAEDDSYYRLTGECGILDDPDHKFPGELANADSGSFMGPADQSAEVFVEVFDSTDSAEDAYDDVTRLYQECRGQMEEGFAEAMTSGIGAGTPMPQVDINVGIRDFSIANDAPESSAMRASFEMTAFGRTVSGTMDMVALRVGGIVGQSIYFTLGELDVAKEEEIINAFVERMNEADDSL